MIMKIITKMISDNQPPGNTTSQHLQYYVRIKPAFT